jgi:hypothetical protein
VDTRRLTGTAGLTAALLFGLGNSLWGFEQPNGGVSGRDVVAFYTDNSTQIVVGGSLSLLAIAAFVLFGSGLRSILRELDGDDVLADTAFAGALVMVITGLGAETINLAGALRAHDSQLTPELGRALFEVSYVLGYNAAGVGVGILVLATSSVALRRRALLPRWAALVGIALGVAFLTPLSRYLLAPAVPLFIVLSAGFLRKPAPSRPA